MKTQKLLDVCDIQYGYPFDSSKFTNCSEEGMPLIRIRDVMNGFTETYYIGEYPIEYLVQRGDYLIGMDGEFNISDWKSQDALLNQRVCKIRPKNSDVLTGYIYRFLKKELKRIEDETPFVTVKHLSAKRLDKVCLHIPPIEEQQRIVTELDLLSSIIEKQKAQLRELDTLAQSIFYDMFGDPVTNEKGWNTNKLINICVSVADGDHMPPPKSNKGIPFLTISNINKELRTLDFSDTFFVDKKYYENLKEDRRARKNDLLYTVTGSYGIPIIIYDDMAFCFQRHIALIRPDNKFTNACFLSYCLLCPSMKSIADDVATGIAQKTVGINSLRQFQIILPPLTLQQQFADKIQSIESQKSAITKSIAETQKLFDYTMDKYFG